METQIGQPWQAIHRHLIEQHGLDLSRYKESYLRRRIQVRLRALKLGGIAAYVRHLRRHPGEMERLQKALSIKVTSFFRNRSCYTFLEESIVPELLQRNHPRGQRITIWSAGCATGEEPYSLAALFATAIDRRPSPRPEGASRDAQVRIDATDIDEGALGTARRGAYPAKALLGSSPGEAARHFTLSTDGMAAPGARLRSMVRFTRESLLDPVGRTDLDLIVCRNVLIYFSLEHQARILLRFARALSAGGFLVLGRVERLFGEARPLFDVVSARDRVYRRLPIAARETTDDAARQAGDPRERRSPGSGRAAATESFACA